MLRTMHGTVYARQMYGSSLSSSSSSSSFISLFLRNLFFRFFDFFCSSWKACFHRNLLISMFLLLGFAQSCCFYCYCCCCFPFFFYGVARVYTLLSLSLQRSSCVSASFRDARRKREHVAEPAPRFEGLRAIDSKDRGVVVMMPRGCPLQDEVSLRTTTLFYIRKCNFKKRFFFVNR